MDANGLRISYPHPQGAKANRRCVLFFGDSYTFGWGLNDQDTMPYRVAVRAGEMYRIYNLAFLTHGAHQMLAALEHGLTNKAVECAPREIKYVIYSASADHVRRAAGLREIDLHHGPRYVLGASGSVSYQGQFGEDRSTAEKISSRLAKSFLYRKLTGGNAVYTRRANGDDVALYLEIVDAARARIKALFPNSEFHVLVWGYDSLDKDKVLAQQITKGLSDKGLSVYRVNDILPGSDDGKSEYFMGGFDLHPNAVANDRIAEYIVRRVLKQ